MRIIAVATAVIMTMHMPNEKSAGRIYLCGALVPQLHAMINAILHDVPQDSPFNDANPPADIHPPVDDDGSPVPVPPAAEPDDTSPTAGPPDEG